MDPSEEVLAHYGVLGMKWGKRQASDSTSSTPKASKEVSPEKAAKRAANSERILVKARAAQADISDMESRGLKSKYLIDKYGPAMGVPGRAADMSILLKTGRTKEQLLAAELKGRKADNEHLLSDASLAAQGKMTQRQKMLVGAGVTVGILAVAGGVTVGANMHAKNEAAAKIVRAAKRSAYDKELEADRVSRKIAYDKDMAESKRISSLKAGDKIPFTEYWNRLQTTEMGRVGGISKDAFDKMDDTPIMVPAGTTFKRISTDKEPRLRENIFAAYKEQDVNRYKAALPRFWGAWGISNEKKGGYEVSIEAVKDISSPSQKQRVKNLIDLMDKSITGKDMGDEFTQTGRQWFEESLGQFVPAGTKRALSNEEFVLKNYNAFSMGWVNKTPLNAAYFDATKKQGFNALIDDNDSGKLSEAPMFIFNTSETMKRVGATPLTSKDITNARENLVEFSRR